MPRLQVPIDVVLFDAVGTLIYPRPSVAEIYRAAGEEFGARLDTATIAARFREALGVFASYQGEPCTSASERARWRQIVAHVFAPAAPDEKQIDCILEVLWRHFEQPANWAVFDDAAGCLAELATAGYRLGVASNFDERLERICHGLPELAPLRELFPVTRVGFAKPAAAYYAEVTRLLEEVPERILLVGDEKEHDVVAARRAGWQAVLLDREAGQFLPEQPQIRSLAELPDLLAGPAAHGRNACGAQ